MARAPLSLSPLACCCYEVGVRLGQILRLSKPGSPYGVENSHQIRPIIAWLCKSFAQLSQHTDITRTPLTRIVARGGCRRHLDPLARDWSGGSGAKALIQEFRNSI